MSAEKWITAANNRLSGVKMSLLIQGKSSLYLQGTFPPKPWEENQRRRQRKVSLGIMAIEESDVKKAEGIARQVALDLNRNKFEWTEFPGIVDPRTPPPTTIEDWAKRLEEERRPRLKADTWRYNYETLMQSLPMNEPLTEEVLIRWILDVDPECSTMRGKLVTIAVGLCEVADVPSRRIKRLQRDSPNKAVNPRDLPEDDAIVAMWRSITDPEWAWAYGMLAVYGLRPHELFRLDTSLFPRVRVLQNSKTGERIVPAIHPEWIAEFGLSEKIMLPSNLDWHEEQANWRLGLKIGAAFRKKKYGNPYDLRHCCARELLKKGLTSDISAKIMGHSREVHERSYRAFIKSSVYVEAAERAIAL